MTAASLVLPVVGVVGAGTMGAGIAQLALEAGHRTLIHDVDERALERARARIADGLARRARTRGRSPEAADEWAAGELDRLEAVTDLEGLGRACEVVIEAAVEDLELKRTVFAILDGVARPDTILATNTSALPVGAIAAVTRHPSRVLGLHFFNPAPVMALVEVVAPPETEAAVADRAAALVRAWGKTPVRSADLPGFIVNRVNRPFTLEALRILESGRGTVEGIDAALRGDGFPMGPFELMDLVGLDVNLAAARAIFEAFGHEPRFRPAPIQERLVAAGRLGRKTGEGFYRYDAAGGTRPADAFGQAGAAQPRASAPAPQLAPDAVVERVLLSVVNEAYLALGERVAASAADIDLALRLGAAHPRGPFEQVERFGGPAGVAERLERLRREAEPGAAESSTERFSPAPLLREAAAGA